MLRGCKVIDIGSGKVSETTHLKRPRAKGNDKKKSGGEGHSILKRTSDSTDFSNDKPWVRGRKQTLVDGPEELP